MRPTAGLSARRAPYEEPHHTRLAIDASDGVYCGSVELYCDIADLERIAHGLQGFPRRPGDEFVYEYRAGLLWRLRAVALDGVGHCALQVEIDAGPGAGSCRCWLPTEPAALDRLGACFGRLAQPDAPEFDWSPDDDRP